MACGAGLGALAEQFNVQSFSWVSTVAVVGGWAVMMWALLFLPYRDR
jgi:hypothetical protein